MAINKVTGAPYNNAKSWAYDKPRKIVKDPLKKETNPFNKLKTKVGKPKETLISELKLNGNNLGEILNTFYSKINEIVDGVNTNEGRINVLEGDVSALDTRHTQDVSALETQHAQDISALETTKAPVHTHPYASTTHPHTAASVPHTAGSHAHSVSRMGGKLQRGGRTRPVPTNKKDLIRKKPLK